MDFMSGDHKDLWPHVVPPEMLKTLARPHSKDVPGIPFSWMVSYTGKGARQNIRYFENGIRHCKLDFPIRVFFSSWTDAVVVTFVPLEAIREIHVMEWYSTFYEVQVEEAKVRLDHFPNFPYDGRRGDLVRAEIVCNGGYQPLIDESRRRYAEMGISLPSHHEALNLWRRD